MKQLLSNAWATTIDLLARIGNSVNHCFLSICGIRLPSLGVQSYSKVAVDEPAALELIEMEQNVTEVDSLCGGELDEYDRFEFINMPLVASTMHTIA